MVLIMVTSWIPPDKGTEVGKKYLEVTQKIPFESFEKPLVNAGNMVKDGLKVIVIVEVEKGKFPLSHSLCIQVFLNPQSLRLRDCYYQYSRLCHTLIRILYS